MRGPISDSAIVAAVAERGGLQDFANKVADIFALFANIVQPRSFNDLKTYGFGDPPPRGSAAQSQP